MSAENFSTNNGPTLLIIAASIGSGHVKAAEALKEEIQRQFPAAKVLVIDFTRSNISWANAFMKNVYLLMLRFVPNLYSYLYRFTGGRYGGLSVQSLISWLTQRDINNLIKKYRPLAVISTHPFPAGAVSWYRAKKSGRFDFAAATVVTDYSIHQMWIYPNVDFYYVARETMKNDLIAAGLRPEQVVVSGIPAVRTETADEETRKKLAKDYGLDPDRLVVLLMGGGLGLGGVDGALDELENIAAPLEILVVAGKNEKLREKVEKKATESHHHISVWGYTDQVPNLMKTADLLISKPGALTISEALNLGLPMLLHSPIPGPETENAVYISRRGAASWLGQEDGAHLGQAAASLLNDPSALKAMQEAAKNLRKPAAAEEIARHFLARIKDATNPGKVIY